MGELKPTNDGFIKRHKKLVIGYFAQHQIDSLNPTHSAYDHIRELMPEATEAQRRARLARFGLGVKNAETQASDLSGGEKARLLFSLISFHAPHLLVLDEPANHLDMDSRAELIKSLNAYEGAILVISHDRNLLESVVDRLWLVDQGRVITYEGSLEDYRKLQLEKHKPEKKTQTRPEKKKDFARKSAAEARKRIAPLKQKYDRIEERIEAAHINLIDIDKALGNAELFTNDPERAVNLGRERNRLTQLIENLEDEGLSALEAYEAAKVKEGL